MIAKTTNGQIEGIERDGVQVFRGIPYAAPPVGPLRFRPPQPAEPWDGVRDGSRFGPMAIQGVGSLEAMLGANSFAQSEDCLSLNVSTPAVDDRARPVMVWIHGGGFVTGTGSIPWYHGTKLSARHDVVVVSINYRLGALGFSHVPGLGETYAGSGNCGILDQVAALEWVGDNIAGFGGDPGNVTIFGESAGGMSVGTLLGTPAAAGLFHRAIAQSGAAQAIRDADRAEELSVQLAERFGGAEGLLDAPVDELLAAQAEVAASTRFVPGSDTLLPFGPVVDGVVLPEQPLDAIAAGMSCDVDVVGGTNLHEFTLFALAFPPEAMTEDRLRRNVERVVGERAGAVLDAYRAHLPGASVEELLVAVSTDLVFRLPCEELLAAHSRNGGTGTSRSYLFTYESPAFDGRLRSTHALEIPFVFGVVDRPGNELFLGEIGPDALALADACSSYWTEFAATGTIGDWPTWDPENRRTMELGVESGVREDPGATHAPRLGVSITDTWQADVLPALEDYITIPAVSPMFDPDWDEHGHIAEAVEHVRAWCAGRPIEGLTVEVHHLEGRTPVILVEVAPFGTSTDDTVLLYGHLDKQPPMDGWLDGLDAFTPVRRGDRLYGRGGADDGYAAFAALTAIEHVQRRGGRHVRCVLLVEASEESGSPDLPAHIDALADRIGEPSLVVALDSGAGSYDQLWATTSLRGLMGIVLRVDVLTDGVHSGAAGGVVPSSFRILRQLLDRIEDPVSGRLLLPELHAAIPADRASELAATAAELGDGVVTGIPAIPGLEWQPGTDPEALLRAKTWEPSLAYVGAAGLPPVGIAGNVLRASTSLKLSFRLPPTVDPAVAAHAVSTLLDDDPPAHARVTAEVEDMGAGWNAPPFAPWLRDAMDAGSLAAFGQPVRTIGEGGSIPFMAMLGERFPDAQFLITGVLGPGNGAHGPNEFIHVPFAIGVTDAVAHVLDGHARRQRG